MFRTLGEGCVTAGCLGTAWGWREWARAVTRCGYRRVWHLASSVTLPFCVVLWSKEGLRWWLSEEIKWSPEAPWRMLQRCREVCCESEVTMKSAQSLITTRPWPKNWCFWTVVLEKTPESPLDCKESQSVHPKDQQSWVFIGRSDVEAETPILWPPDVRSWLILKDPDAGKDWGREEKGTTEDEMVGWHHWLNGHEFE